MSNSTCLRADLENSNIGSVNKSQAPSKQKPDGGLNEVAYSQPKATHKHHPFQASGYTQNTKAPTRNVNPTARRAGHQAKPDWRAALAGYWRDPLANTGELLRLDAGRILGKIHRQGILSEFTQRDTWRDPLAGCSGGILCGIQLLLRDTRRDPLASCSAILGGILGGIHLQAALLGDTGWGRGVEASQTRNPT